MKNMVHFGFSSVILIMTLLMFVWLVQIKESNKTVMDLIGLYDVKIHHAHTMRTVVMDRYNLLLSMLIIDDPFELDEKVSKFYNRAFDYRTARKALHDLPMNGEEKEIHDLLDKLSALPQPENIRATEMFRAGAPREEIIKVIKSVKKYQSELILTLDRFVNLQKTDDEQAVKFSRKMFDDSIYWISFFGVVAFIISIIISSYVGRAVANKNRQLLQAGDDMAEAYKKAEEATVIKSEFLATMSHEMRTPLTAIIGFAETTLFSEQTIEQRQNAIQTIIRSGKHLLQIINDILDLSKVEANKLEIESVELIPVDLLADVDRLIRPAAEIKGLGFSINYIFPLPRIIVSDPLRLKQILINLCNNAIKFTEKGHVLINVSCNFNDNVLVFEVIDSGVGINEEQQSFIFQAYRQADSSTTREFGGTGLGLSLSKFLAERLGGDLTVTSEPGKGSNFKLALAIDTLSDSDIVYDKEHLPVASESKVKIKPSIKLNGHVLLAEDNKDNQELLLIYLRRMGVDVTIVENGLLAVNAVKDNQFDLILMDMRMPVMSGLDAMQQLRQDGFDKPIIALTANAMREDKTACIKSGANDFLTKPVDVNHLTQTLEKYLKKGIPNSNKESTMATSLFNRDPEVIKLARKFINSLPSKLSEISKLTVNKNWDDLIDILHQLKGSAGHFGCPEISVMAGKMEFQATCRNIEELNLIFEDLNKYYLKIVKELG